MKELLDLLEKLDKMDRLVLPNGAKGAVWLADVIEVIIKNYREKEGVQKEEDFTFSGNWPIKKV